MELPPFCQADLFTLQAALQNPGERAESFEAGEGCTGGDQQGHGDSPQALQGPLCKLSPLPRGQVPVHEEVERLGDHHGGDVRRQSPAAQPGHLVGREGPSHQESLQILPGFLPEKGAEVVGIESVVTLQESHPLSFEEPLEEELMDQSPENLSLSQY